MLAWLASSTMTTSNESRTGASVSSTTSSGMIQAGTALRASRIASRARPRNLDAYWPVPLPNWRMCCS